MINIRDIFKQGACWRLVSCNHFKVAMYVRVHPQGHKYLVALFGLRMIG